MEVNKMEAPFCQGNIQHNSVYECILLTTKNRPQMGTAYNVGINGVYYGYGGRLEYPKPHHLDWHYVQAVH